MKRLGKEEKEARAAKRLKRYGVGNIRGRSVKVTLYTPTSTLHLIQPVNFPLFSPRLIIV